MSLIPASIRWRFVTVLPMFVLAACAGSTSDDGTPGGQGGSTMGTVVRAPAVTRRLAARAAATAVGRAARR